MTKTVTGLNDLIGQSPSMRELRAMIARVAPTRLPVLIYGETGSGKELVAAALHAESGRTGAFVPFNVCALGDSMFEDSLFGHVRGAYTGALRDAPGFLREADRGTVFLDEVSGLAVGLQAKLLRAIELGVFRPIGATRDVRSDFRVVAATNEPVAELVEQGRLRADLAHRLCGVIVKVPSLAERPEDVPLLVEYFLQRATTGLTWRIDARAIRRLQDQPWKGNVRELRQVVETAAVFGHGVLDERSVGSALANRATSHSGSLVASEARSELMRLLESCNWDAEKVAAVLGVHRATVYRRMKRLGLNSILGDVMYAGRSSRHLELA